MRATISPNNLVRIDGSFMPADQYAVGILEVGDGRAFGQELGIGEHLEMDIGLPAVQQHLGGDDLADYAALLVGRSTAPDQVLPFVLRRQIAEFAA